MIFYGTVNQSHNEVEEDEKKKEKKKERNATTRKEIKFQLRRQFL